MKTETMVTLSEDDIAELAQPSEDAGDLEIINLRSVELNEEASDVLEYQVMRSAIFSPRLARPEQASDFEKAVIGAVEDALVHESERSR
ncbi:MAG TPA: hypothetical protein VEW48_25360 [Thermoanaerobaculia bacterium]|nr:hypothetical protein [Thermoanaerobaculia bacterium]